MRDNVFTDERRSGRDDVIPNVCREYMDNICPDKENIKENNDEKGLGKSNTHKEY